VKSAHAKIGLTAAVVAVYTLVPVFAGLPALTPDVFRQSLAGVPVGVLFVVALLFGFPALAWLCSAMLSAGKDGEGEQ
jgi:hypothetical protein